MASTPAALRVERLAHLSDGFLEEVFTAWLLLRLVLPVNLFHLIRFARSTIRGAQGGTLFASHYEASLARRGQLVVVLD